MVKDSSKEPGRATAAAPSRLVLILGAPRSGTSWLGKIFDSHPSVIYRHEPDDVLRQSAFPQICPADAVRDHLEAARCYITSLTTVSQVKTSGTRPVFAKPFQPVLTGVLRRGLVLSVRVAESLLPHATWPKQLTIPDLIRGDVNEITYVIKSVSLLGAIALLSQALPGSRIIAVYRHPCGYIASLKRGLGVRTMRGGIFGPAMLAATRANEFGLTQERYEKLPPLERFSWGWALVHAKLFEEARALGNVRLLRYEDLCREPMRQARELMAFTGLPWSEKTARFIRKSTQGNGFEGYYSVFRDPLDAASKWRRELKPAEIDSLMAVVDKVLPSLFQ